MALTPEEKQMVLDKLDDLDRSSLKRVLTSFDSFLGWLKLTFSLIYLKLINEKNDLMKMFFNFLVESYL